MPPPGRRRFSNLHIFLSLFILCISTASAAQAVLGIDLGTEYIKAALVKPGIPLDIVLTKDSKRKETAAVAFKGGRTKSNSATDDNFPERIYGGDAVALSARFPGDVYPNLKPLLGLSYKDDMVAEYSSWRPELQLVENKGTSSVGFKSGSFVAEEEAFSVEELLAMELKNVKANGEIMAGKGYAISDVVITVPSFYTAEERKAVTMAADLAGLRVLSLISDGLAVGLNYATSRTFPTVNDGGTPEIHLVYDMGAGSTTASVLRFQGKIVKDIGKYNKTVQEVQVLGTSWDRTLGGDAFNGVIVDDIIEKIIETPHMKGLDVTAKHIKGHGRTMAKLWKESERIRQIMSANSETQSTFESLFYEDFNFKYKLTRTRFEELTAGFTSRVQKPMEEALEAAKLSMTDLESVILHGGAVRTPFVQKQLEAAIKDPEKIRTNVNSDEAAVFGAAFKAAGISPSFRVKEIRASDAAVYPVFASWSLEGKDKLQKLFVPTSQVGAEKQIAFKTTEDFSFDLFQKASTPSANLPVSSIKTQNLTESVKKLEKLGCESSDISTKFAIRLSPADSLPEIVSSTVSCEIMDVKKSGSVVDGMKDFLGFGSKKDTQEPLIEDLDIDASESSSSSSSLSSSSSSATSESSKSTSSATTETAKLDKPAKKKIEIIPIAFTTTSTDSSGFSLDSTTRLKARLAAFDTSDRARVLREEALNTLEGYTYKIRDILEQEDFIKASTAAQRDEIEQKSNDASTWLYGDGADATRETLKARLDELRGLVNPISRRKEEFIKRPEEVKKLEDALSQASTMINMVKQQQEAQKAADAELAASQAASSESSSDSTTTASDSVPTDDFADLDDEPSSSKSAKASPSAQGGMFPDTKPIYSDEDIDAITETEAAVKTWLETKLVEQEKLAETDEPVLLSSEIAAKSKEVNDAVMNLLTRQMKNMPKVSSSKSKKSKTTKKTKSASTSSTDSASDTTSSTASAPPPDSSDDGSSSTISAETGTTTAAASVDADEATPASAASATDLKIDLEDLDDMEGFAKMSPEDLKEAMKEKFGQGDGGKPPKAKARTKKAASTKKGSAAAAGGKKNKKKAGEEKAKTKGKGKGKGKDEL